MNATQNLTQIVGLLFENDTAQYPGIQTSEGHSGNLNFTLWNATLGTLSFDPSKTDYSAIDQTVNDLFRPEVFSYIQPCGYAISGQYGFLPRLLYYALLIFALILRKHTWLSPAALGVAMSYGATACVHAFALLARYKYHYLDYSEPAETLGHASDYGDVDLFGILPILIAGCIMITPILNWSVTVREKGFRPVVVYWGILLFSALVGIMIRILHKGHGITPYVVYSQLATCVKNETTGCTKEYIYSHNLTTSWNSYNKCGCNDTCGAVTIPGIPFRKDTSIQPWLVHDRTESVLQTNAYLVVYALNFLFLAFIVLQGCLGLIESQWTPAEIRNWFLRIISGTATYSSRTTTSKFRYYVGSLCAGSFYGWTVLGIIICPAVFISSVIIDEILAWGYPVNESSDAVGQWATWVGALFVLLTALIQRYHSAWVASVELGLRALVRFVEWTLGKAPLRAEPEKEFRTTENSVVEDAKEFFRQCAIPFIYSWESIAISWLRVIDEWHDFRRWAQDPVDVSTHPQARQKHALPHYHRALSDHHDPAPVKDSIAAKMQSTTSGSSLDNREDHTDFPLRDQTRHTISRWHPNPLPPEAGDISPVFDRTASNLHPVSNSHPASNPPAASLSYPLEPEPSPPTASNAPPLPLKNPARRSTDGVPDRSARQEAPRRGSDNQVRTRASPEPSTSWLHDL